jgi:threonine synthase
VSGTTVRRMRSRDAGGNVIGGLRCAVCGTFVDIASVAPWQCPRRTASDPHHVLHLVSTTEPVDDLDDANPLVRYGRRLAWWSFARANGLDDEACADLTRRVADGFVITPFDRSAALSDEIGADVWVKDETGQVAGSQKGRHLASILLHLLAAEELGLTTGRPPLAIASCGNAALAAATLAHRVGWPIDVYVPSWMDPAFGRRLDELGARIHTCERRTDDPAGDPAMLRFREAVTEGAVPFSVQGPENALCLDGGRTTGWEIADQAADAGISLDRVLVQVGGGAFAAAVGAGLGPSVRLDAVQAAGCAPLAAAARRAAAVAEPARHWSEIMQPWPDPHSAADGILDDETYDWLADLDVMRRSGGAAIVATEAEIVRAHGLATAAGYQVSVTGSAGLAGLLHVRDDLSPHDRVAVIMSGVAAD